jgi:hypothetical protein
MQFILSSFNLNSPTNDKELLEEIVANDLIVMQVAITCVNTWEYFILA